MSAGRIGTRAALVAVGVLASVLLMAAPSWAAKPGNSPNAKLCQKGKWETLVNGEGHLFKSEAECVAYGAKGGTPQPATPHLKLLAPAQFALESGGIAIYEYSFRLFSGTTARETFTVENSGTGAASALALSVEPPWTISNDHCSGNGLAALGGKCTFEAAVTPPCEQQELLFIQPVPVFANGVKYTELSLAANCFPNT